MRAAVEVEANAHLSKVNAASKSAADDRQADREAGQLDAFKADIAARRLAGQVR